MQFTIKSRLLLLGAGALLAMAALATINYVNSLEVEETTQRNARRLDESVLALRMKFLAQEMTLAAMDAIVDREDGAVAPERKAVIDENAAFLQENLPRLADAAKDEKARQAVAALEQELPTLIQAIRKDLVDVIETSAGRLDALEAEFDALDEVIDDAGETLITNAGRLAVNFETQAQQALTPFEERRLLAAVDEARRLQVAALQLNLVAMEAMLDRKDGLVSDERMTIMGESAEAARDGVAALSPLALTEEAETLVEEASAALDTLVDSATVTLPELIRTSAAQAESVRQRFSAIDEVIDENAENALQQLGDLAEHSLQELYAANDTLENDVDNASWNGLFVSLGAGAFVVLALFFTVRSITTPLSRTVEYADAVAGGDLDATLRLDSQDELGRLANALRRMVTTLKESLANADEKTREAELESERAQKAVHEAEMASEQAFVAKQEGLHEAAAQLEGIVNALTGSAEGLNVQIAEAARGAALQSERAGETATAMEEMNATVLEVANNAGQASESAENARDNAVRGATVVDGVVRSIQEVADQAQTMKQGLDALDKRAESIGGIMNVISDIADQTNLLALNAAIEAARAGEAGRGFAVVADEVRKLAEKTMTATKEVGEAVNAIQQETHNAVRAMDTASDAVQHSSTQAGEAGAALDAIVEIVEHTSDQVRSIATAVEQQSASSEEINRAVEDMNRISTETAQGMGEAERVVTEIGRLSDELARLMEALRQQ